MSGPVWLARGEALSHVRVIERAARARIVLLGERHDRADHHRWQLHMAAALAGRRPVALGFEMFPARVDPILAEWVGGGLSEADFLTRVGWTACWGFDAGLYLPLFRFCREAGVPMVGLNVHRDLVRAVGAGGWDAAPETLREGLSRPAPSPAAYRRLIFELTGGARPDRKAQSPDDPAFDRFVGAQEVWDRAFAERLARMLAAAPDRLAIGIMGMGHVQFGGGVPWQLRDLGLTETFVAIPADAEALPDPDAADAVCRLPMPRG
ncbi:ChaN family lipoprotein [Paracoccus sp. (in: a-proteobacteria)]|uniref:ChaN family lipoprotein n=1 Tax=Paracoccus sp. TaxID=267 RepID=UPI00321FD3F2